MLYFSLICVFGYGVGIYWMGFMVVFPLMCWSVVGGRGEIELVWGFVVAKWDDDY